MLAWLNNLTEIIKLFIKKVSSRVPVIKRIDRQLQHYLIKHFIEIQGHSCFVSQGDSKHCLVEHLHRRALRTDAHLYDYLGQTTIQSQITNI